MTIRTTVTIILLSMMTSLAFASASIDIHTQRLLDSGKSQHALPHLAKTFQKHGETFIHIFIEGPVNTLPALRALGVQINTVTQSGIMSAAAPLQKIIAISQVAGIERITAAHSVKKFANISTGPIGVNLPNVSFPRQEHSGKNVIVGIIDSGIDIGHPDFFDANNIYGPPRFARTHFSFGRKQLQSYIRLLDEIGLSSPDGIRALSSLSTHRFYIKNPCCNQVFKSAGLPFMPSLLFALRNWWCLLL